MHRLTNILIAAVATYALNLIWEVAQAPLYAGYRDFWQNLPMCAWASLGDVVIVAAIYALFAVVHRDIDWVTRLRLEGLAAIVVVGALVGVAVEWWALATVRWDYAAMPILPVVRVGLLPVMQLMVIPPVLFLGYARYATLRG